VWQKLLRPMWKGLHLDASRFDDSITYFYQPGHFAFSFPALRNRKKKIRDIRCCLGNLDHHVTTNLLLKHGFRSQHGMKSDDSSPGEGKIGILATQ
jgi:hypothetical protein